MKILKDYNNFINESIHKEIDMLPERDENYDFLMDICEKTKYETTMLFYAKDLIEIGKSGSHKLYLNYLDRNEYDERLSFWVVYNEKDDELYGTSWDSGVIWEEDDKLKFTEKHDFDLYPNFIEIISNEIRKYNDLDEWINYIKYVGITRRKYHRWAIQDNRKGLTWEERLEWVRNNIESDKLLNRHSKPYDEKSLEEMLRLGEEKWKELDDKRNKYMMKILQNWKNSK